MLASTTFLTLTSDFREHQSGEPLHETWHVTPFGRVVDTSLLSCWLLSGIALALQLATCNRLYAARDTTPRSAYHTLAIVLMFKLFQATATTVEVMFPCCSISLKLLPGLLGENTATLTGIQYWNRDTQCSVETLRLYL